MAHDVSSEHLVDQETLIRSFLEENVRIATTLEVRDTTVEFVDFQIILDWNIFIKWQDSQITGRYKGDAGSAFVQSEQELGTAVSSYAARILATKDPYDASANSLQALPEFGLDQINELKIRNESAEFVFARLCHECGGNGRVVCPSCGGSCRQSCGGCGGRGRKSCNQCDGTGRITYQETYTSGSTSQSRTTFRQCHCMGGTVTCSSCRGSGEESCWRCSGQGSVTCSRCNGTCWLSTLRRMTLAASPRRRFALPDLVSENARMTFERYDPAKFPRLAYEGRWRDAPTTSFAEWRLTFVKDSSTRYLESNVHIGDEVFPFRTFGTTLHIASGGGVVEHLLSADRFALISALSIRFTSKLVNPVSWIVNIIAATKNCLDSRIHVHLLDRKQGLRHAEDIVGSVSVAYEDEVVAGLTRALKLIDRATVGTVLVCGVCASALFALIALHPWRGLLTASRIQLGISALSYQTILPVAAIAASILVLARIVAPAVFLRKEDEPVLRCLSNAKGTKRSLRRFGALLIAIFLVLGAMLRFS